MAYDRNRAESMRLLHDTLIYNLNEVERRQFTVILSNFQARREREKFVVSLRRLLNSPKKQEVVPYLLVILPNREREHFLKLWMQTSQYNHFYRLDENQNARYTRKQNISYDNLYRNHQKQEQRYNRRRIPGTAPKLVPNTRPPLPPRPHSSLSNNRLSASLPSLRSPNTLEKQPKTHLISLKRGSKGDGFGFSIRGGAEHGLGIYVSSVEEGSIAEKKHLCCGDQIIKLNEFNFQKIDHAAAVKVIQQNKKLRMHVFSASLVPGARLSHMEYQWVDTNGRPSSPPLNFRERSGHIGRSRSIGDIRLLQDDEERRVIVHVQSGARLGVKIRGGVEYGLGIYVSAVDRNHVAERSGIRAGDQIIDVNGLDFLEIYHKDAVRVLKSCKMMSMILRHIGKVPYAKTLFEKTEWLDSARTSRSSSVVSIAHDGRASPSPERSKFRQGIAGSQLLHQSAVVVPAHRRIEEQARSMLSEKELASLKYYISEYIQGSIHVEGLVISLFHLFDSSEKISLLNEVRSVVFPQDLDVFDRLVLEREIEARKSLSQPSPRKDQRVNGTSRLSPNVPAKALSYKQLKSPRRQTSKSKVPWSPPSAPQPKIPTDEPRHPVLKTEQVQVHHQAPVIDDLDFEEDEDPKYAAINLEPPLEPPQRSSSPDLKEDVLRRIIEEGMRKLNAGDDQQESGGARAEESPRSAGITRLEDGTSSADQHTAASPRGGLPERRESEIEDDDIGLSLMRSALADFGKSIHSEGESNQCEDDLEDTQAAKETFHALDLGGEEAVREAQSEGAPFGFLGQAMFKPSVVVEEDLAVVRETAVGSGPMSPSRDDDTEADPASDRVDFSPASNTPVIHDKDSIREDRDGSDDGGIFDLSGFSQRSRVGLDGRVSGGCDANESEDAALQGVEPLQDDLEFEFDDEPELAEPDMQETDSDSTTLKFAPIKLQETAPSTPSVDAKQNLLNKDDRPAERAQMLNIYEADPTLLRPVGFLSSRNRRQRYDVEDVPDNQFRTSAGFQNFNPKILSGRDVGLAVENSPTEKNKRTESDSSEGSSPKHDRADQDMHQGTGNNISGDSVLVLPDRNLTAKRIPIVSYRARSPEKGTRDGNEIVREIEEMAAANRKKQEDDENSEDRSAFRNLRSIFEYQRLETPKTEYLSEIIKKNNSEGRRRFRSSDSVDDTEEETTSFSPLSNGMAARSQDDGRPNRDIAPKYPLNLGENDLSSTDDFDFSSMRFKPKVNVSLNSPTSDDKTEISSGYGSEDSPIGGAQRKVVRIEKGREELGIELEASKKQKRAVQIKAIKTGECYAACMHPQLEVGQEVVSVDGEPLHGLGVQIASISMKRAYNNPSGRFLEVVVKSCCVGNLF